MPRVWNPQSDFCKQLTSSSGKQVCLAYFQSDGLRVVHPVLALARRNGFWQAAPPGKTARLGWAPVL